jgi:4-hydroxythreonine-4-phosphate dehydrogenase
MLHQAPSGLVVSTGDPAGIGPELIARLWEMRGAEALPPFACVGSATLLQAAAASVGIDLPVARIETMAQAGDIFADALPVIDLGDIPYRPGQPDAQGARLALDSLTRASAMAVSGEAGGILTAPIAKAELARIGFTHPGQTEFVAEACGVPADDAVMMLAGPSLRVVPVTVHVALSRVPALLSARLIHRRTAIAARALQRDFGIAAPRIAVAGLNPHAGENGRMGDEDAAIITPAVEHLRADGFDVRGPLPADTMFHAAARETYDFAVCMYHDQALIPLKALDFDKGVNVTLGLPVIRTSPDHGTAFDIAGTGRAHAGPMLAALRMAGECAARRHRIAA